MKETPMQRRATLSFVTASILLAMAPGQAFGQAFGQAYPNRPLKIIVPAPPGGAIDTIARVVGDKLAISLGQPVVVDNKPGASNNIGTDALAQIGA
jgi:tripartite-type tricarboxylate transporter receptor subunit TctC